MLSLILLSWGLVLEFVLLPWRILYGLFRSGRGLAILVVVGLLSMASGIVTILLGSLRSLLPWILIAAGIAMIVRANRTHPEVREDAFESFYAHHRT